MGVRKGTTFGLPSVPGGHALMVHFGCCDATAWDGGRTIWHDEDGGDGVPEGFWTAVSPAIALSYSS